MDFRYDDLVALIETQIAHYRCLQQTLEAEARAGAEGDIAALVEAVRAKEKAMAAIRLCDTRRCKILSSGLDAGPLTLSEMAGRLPGPRGERLKELGATLKAEVAEARRINRSNGDLMAHCLKLVQRSLAMLNHLLVPQLVYQPVGVPAYRNAPVHRFSQRA